MQAKVRFEGKDIRKSDLICFCKQSLDKNTNSIMNIMQNINRMSKKLERPS